MVYGVFLFDRDRNLFADVCDIEGHVQGESRFWYPSLHCLKYKGVVVLEWRVFSDGHKES